MTYDLAIRLFFWNFQLRYIYFSKYNFSHKCSEMLLLFLFTVFKRYELTMHHVPTPNIGFSKVSMNRQILVIIRFQAKKPKKLFENKLKNTAVALKQQFNQWLMNKGEENKRV